MSLHTGWQTERFARLKVLKSFLHYAKALMKKPDPAASRGRQTPGELLSTFHALAADGAPIRITRIK